MTPALLTALSPQRFAAPPLQIHFRSGTHGRLAYPEVAPVGNNARPRAFFACRRSSPRLAAPESGSSLTAAFDCPHRALCSPCEAPFSLANRRCARPCSLPCCSAHRGFWAYRNVLSFTRKPRRQGLSLRWHYMGAGHAYRLSSGALVGIMSSNKGLSHDPHTRRSLA
jgi:hypothetical protein